MAANDLVTILIRSLLLVSVVIGLVHADNQVPLESKGSSIPRKVAIIGAGSGGASTAYYLQQFAHHSHVPVNITVFEHGSYVGGRSTTVNVFDDPSYPIELGASIFVSVNHNLMDAAQKFGLEISNTKQPRDKETQAMIGIWDGKRFVYMQKDSMSWWDTAKLIWRYGLAPIRTQRLMKAVVGDFLKMYKPPIFPFASLSAAVVELNLHKATAVTGSQYLETNGISGRFPTEIIQASTRVNYGQNIGLIHGVETMVCMATDGAVSVEGGNWKIFAGMLQDSRAHVSLNTTVNAMQRNSDNTLTLSHTRADHSELQSTFDEVVIAAPFQSTGITVTPAFEHVPDKIPYVTLYVTLFASPHQLSPKTFNMSSQEEVPEMILTTLPEGLDLGSREDGVGPTGFWSISLLRSVISPTNPSQRHYFYKIFSPERPSAAFVASILGVDAPQGSEDLTIGDISEDHVSWFHEKTWHSYPYEYPRQTFEQIKLADNVWYTSGIESFISTMETSSLMGMNVAGLMVNDWHTNLHLGKAINWNRWAEKRNTEL